MRIKYPEPKPRRRAPRELEYKAMGLAMRTNDDDILHQLDEIETAPTEKKYMAAVRKLERVVQTAPQ